LGRGLSLDGQQMLQKLILESSERFSRSSKKKPIKGTYLFHVRTRANWFSVTSCTGSFGALLSLEDKQRSALSAKGGK
jgi:hypothetical protein